jgi:hypothetical protein
VENLYLAFSSMTITYESLELALEILILTWILAVLANCVHAVYYGKILEHGEYVKL